MEPIVSVIMPAYNVTPYIARALNSVFAQSFQNFEVVVVNDGCPDSENLEHVLERYRDRIRYVRQENGGVGAARRTAVLAARSQFVAQLDPDDWWTPDYLEVQLRLLQANPGIDVIYPDGYYFGDGALAGKRVMEYAPSHGPVDLCNLLKAHVNVIYSALIRKQTILDAGNFDPALRSSEDFDLWIRILKSGGKIAYHRAPLFYYRLREGSLTSARIDMQTWAVRVLDKTYATLDLTSEEKACLVERKFALQMEMELATGKAALARKNWADALWHFELYGRYRPSRKISLVVLLLRACPWVLGTGVSVRDRLLRTGLLNPKQPHQTSPLPAANIGSSYEGLYE
jgi:glycosyltransferase involved in cell wall biosynthesis